MADNLAGIHDQGSEQQWLATLSVDGTDYGIFDKFTGGDVTSSVVKHRPGGMGPEITYLSLPVYSDVTLTKVYESHRDHDRVADLHAMVGRVLATVSLQPLGDDGHPFGKVRSYSGRLIGVKDGGTDSNSNAARMFEVDIAVETVSG
jgi:hypothetical protein